ncbi:MAG: translation initiation factor [Phycisphaeraceae bacterium]|nr:translation initiation factor [Phycisphaeraceae bacterium]
MGLFDGTPLDQPVTCEVCAQPLKQCRCPRDGQGKVSLPKDQPVRVQREKRRGKWVTVVFGLDPHATDLPALAKELRATCAAGGTATEDGVEIQGDHRDRILDMLRHRGYPAKAAGG